jgi:hypothetical protein
VALRDKESYVGVFVRFRAPLHCNSYFGSFEDVSFPLCPLDQIKKSLSS